MNMLLIEKMQKFYNLGFSNSTVNYANHIKLNSIVKRQERCTPEATLPGESTPYQLVAPPEKEKKQECMDNSTQKHKKAKPRKGKHRNLGGFPFMRHCVDSQSIFTQTCTRPKAKNFQKCNREREIDRKIKF